MAYSAVTGEAYVRYSYDLEKQRAAQVWNNILDQTVKCESEEESTCQTLHLMNGMEQLPFELVVQRRLKHQDEAYLAAAEGGLAQLELPLGCEVHEGHNGLLNL